MNGVALTRAAVEAVWRVEAPRLLGGLVRFVRDVERAEDLAQAALATALERWPVDGVPERPGAWLMTTAKRRAIDEARHHAMRAAKHAALATTLDDATTRDDEDVSGVDDDVFRLMLAACHPVLSREARIALTLRLVAGLTTAEIARAFLVDERAIAQRLVRAKRTLKEAGVPFDVPHGPALTARLPPVLEVVYLVFNEGYAASSGTTWIRAPLCFEALRLARVLAALVPDDAEVQGLQALLELQASRLGARVDADGDPIPLLEQDRATWDRLLITRGLAALARAEARAAPLGPFALQAAIASCHARATTAEATDWPRIVALYDALVEVTGSPVVELNRAVAVGMACSPAEALALVDELALDPALADYPLTDAVRGEMLARLGRAAEARDAFRRAAARTANARERAHLEKRAAACDAPRA